MHRPISNGKTPGGSTDSTAGRPSILNGRKPFHTGYESGKISDGTNGNGRPNANIPFTPQEGLANGRFPPKHGSSSNLPNGSGFTNGRYPTNIGSQSTDQSRNGGTSHGKHPVDSFGQNRPTSTGDGTGGTSGTGGTGVLSTDAIEALRKAFKLPPGLCLVKCDTLRSGQVLSQDQMKDALSYGEVNGM